MPRGKTKKRKKQKAEGGKIQKRSRKSGQNGGRHQCGQQKRQASRNGKGNWRGRGMGGQISPGRVAKKNRKGGRVLGWENN